MAEKQTFVLKLTREPFDLDILPPANNRTVLTIAHDPETVSLTYIKQICLYMLTSMGLTLGIQDQVYIVMKPAPRAMAAAWMLWVALAQVSIEPDVWVMDKVGVYVGTKDFIGAGLDWANELKETWRERAAVHQLNEEPLREKDGTAE